MQWLGWNSFFFQVVKESSFFINACVRKCIWCVQVEDWKWVWMDEHCAFIPLKTCAYLCWKHVKWVVGGGYKVHVGVVWGILHVQSQQKNMYRWSLKMKTCDWWLTWNGWNKVIQCIYYYYKRGNVAKKFHYTMWGPPLPIRIEYDNIFLPLL